MNDLNNQIQKIVLSSAKKAFGDFVIPEILVQKPKEASHGDYATNVALVLAKQLKKNPLEVAKAITGEINNNLFEKVEAVIPGFINFYLAKEIFVENIEEVLKNKKLKGPEYGRKVIVEYTDPNPFKEFHIGHLMSNAIGETISRIFEFQGARIKRANYQGDVGLHVAKAVWGKMQHPDKSWQEAYVTGTTSYESDGPAKQEIVVLNKKIFERSDKAVNKLYDEGKKWSLAYFEAIYEKLGTKFDYYFFESEAAGFGKKIVESGLEKGIFETGEKGAIVFKGEKAGLHTRVFINSEGLPTYEAKELGLAKIKHDKYKYDTSVIITGNEINEYFKVLMTVMSQIFPELAQKTKHIGHGMLRLPEGKMSSRAGNVVTAEFLIEKVKEMVHKKAVDRALDKATIEAIAVGALKYSILKQSIGSNIIYDFEKSISFDGDSGPYLQYSYARAMSVLKKAKTEKIKSSLKNIPPTVSLLEKMMQYFPEAIKEASKEYEPHVIVLYLTELAREFNNYYAHNKIVETKDEFSEYKVAVTKAFTIIMKNGLWLLGIQAPEKM